MPLPRPLPSLLLIALLCDWGADQAIAQGPEAAEQVASRQRGTIAGRVQQTDGTPLPGLIVVLDGPGPDDEAHVSESDDRARFQFTDLAPGTYRLAVGLPGLEAADAVEVTVYAGQLVETLVQLNLFAYEVDVAVVSDTRQDPEIIAPDATSRRFRMPSRALTRLPLPAEQALEVLPVFPGVVQGPDGLISIGGTLPADSTYRLNGADLSDVYTGDYRFRLPLEAVESVQLQSGVYPAAYGERLGGVVEVSTAPGSDQWSFELASILPRPWIKDGRLQGIRRFTPRMRLAGPLVPGRITLSQSVEYHFDRDRVDDVPNGSGDHIQIEGWESLTQVDWKVDAHNDLRLILIGYPETRQYDGLGGLTPVESTSTVLRRPLSLALGHQVRIDDSSFLRSMVQYQQGSASSHPVTPIVQDAFVLIPDGERSRYYHDSDRRTKHWQLKSSYTRAFGGASARHIFQAGIELHGSSVKGDRTDRSVEVLGNDGSRLRRIEFLTSPRLSGDKQEWALFAQNRFKPSDRLWMDLGVRLSRDGATACVRVAPRAGIAFDLFGNTRTLIKGSAGLLYRRVFLAEQLWDQLPTRAEIRYGAEGGGEVMVLVPRRARELVPPRAFLGTIEISHRFGDSLVALARYSQRQSHDQLSFDLVGHEPLEFAPGEDPLSILPSDLSSLGGEIALTNGGGSVYREIELTANMRLGRQDQLFLSYTRSSAEGDLNDFSLLTNPRPDPILRPNQRAPLRFDAPNRLLLWGTLHLPWELIVAPGIEWRDGFPYSLLAEDQSYLGAAHTARFPTYLRADINVSKGLRVADVPLRVGLQVRNLTNRFNPRQVMANSASPRFGELLNRDGLRLRIRFSAAF